MNGWVLVIDTGEGQQAVLFANQEEAAAWEERHPEAAQAVQGGVPVVGRRAAARAAAAEPHL